MTLHNLTTGYRRHAITTGINTTLRSGEMTCLIGPNGAGKSTLLKTLCNFIPPLSGDILLEGKSIKSLNARFLARSIGVVLTDRLSVMNMSVEELVTLGRNPYSGFFGGIGAEDRLIVNQALNLAGIDNLRCRNFGTLSDGERQKAMIAKALAQQTPIIILDEPTSFLDFPSKVETMRLLRHIAHSENKEVLISTHDLELALQIADRLWLLDKQHGMAIGRPDELAKEGIIAQYFQSDGLTFNAATRRFEIR